MTPDQFFAKFALFADTPNAVAKMRELILDLALSGRLCDGEIASLQHKRIPLEKVASFINGDRGKNYPSAVHRTTDGVPFVNAGHLKNGDICTEDMDYISEERFELLGGGKFQLGDVIYCLRGSLGKCAVVRHLPRGAIASSLLIMRPHDDVLAEFLYYFLVSPSGIRMIKKYDNGSAQPNLSATNVKKFLLPLPPLAEQKRIVAKVDELMALCDQLESQQKQRETKKNTLVQAALTRFTDAPTPANLPFLFHPSYAISPADLRKSILTLAVQGKLVPQDPNDEPAQLMVERIQTLRDRAARGHKRKSKRTAFAVAVEEEFSIPPAWRWCRVDEIALVKLGGTPSRSEPKYWGGSVAWVSSGEVANCRISTTKETITSAGLANSNATIYPPKTVLIAMIGQGKTRGQSAILEINASTNQNVAGLVFDSEWVDSEYVWKWALREYQRTRSGGRGGAQPALNGEKIRELMIPLPPLAEQKRIVAKVEQLMGLVDRLEAQLAESRAKATALLDAVVAELSAAA